eukprot:scaffold8827_cov69-Phaeocystis_antarctica.AAC.2
MGEVLAHAVAESFEGAAQRDAHESMMPRQLSAWRLRMSTASCADGTCSPTSNESTQSARGSESGSVSGLLHVACAVVAVPRHARVGAEQRVAVLAEPRAEIEHARTAAIGLRLQQLQQHVHDDGVRLSVRLGEQIVVPAWKVHGPHTRAARLERGQAPPTRAEASCTLAPASRLRCRVPRCLQRGVAGVRAVPSRCAGLDLLEAVAGGTVNQ